MTKSAKDEKLSKPARRHALIRLGGLGLTGIAAQATSGPAQAQAQPTGVLPKPAVSSPDFQVAFMKGLIEKPNEAKKFLQNPKAYSVQHGVLLDPDVVRHVNDAVIYGITPPPAAATRLGPKGVKAVTELTRKADTAAYPAAVAAGAAAAAAAAAVVEAVVTLVRVKSSNDFTALKGLGPQGQRLPGNLPYKDK